MSALRFEMCDCGWIGLARCGGGRNIVPEIVASFSGFKFGHVNNDSVVMEV